MREVLQSDVDFLHYVGHVDDRGMQCTDDYLDLTDEDLDVGISAFLLNACQSYRQGEALVHRGSRGGIVTLSDVANSPATQLGRIIARLMNGGFNLRTALHVAKRELITGHQYIVVGDGGTTICQSRSGAAAVVNIHNEDPPWNISVNVYPNGPYGSGTMTTPNTTSETSNYYVPGEIDLEDVSKLQLQKFLNLEVLPVFTPAGLVWSDEFGESGTSRCRQRARRRGRRLRQQEERGEQDAGHLRVLCHVFCNTFVHITQDIVCN
jgi:hypothetical protein